MAFVNLIPVDISQRVLVGIPRAILESSCSFFGIECFLECFGPLGIDTPEVAERQHLRGYSIRKPPEDR